MTIQPFWEKKWQNLSNFVAKDMFLTQLDKLR